MQSKESVLNMFDYYKYKFKKKTSLLDKYEHYQTINLSDMYNIMHKITDEEYNAVPSSSKSNRGVFFSISFIIWLIQFIFIFAGLIDSLCRICKNEQGGWLRLFIFSSVFLFFGLFT